MRIDCSELSAKHLTGDSGNGGADTIWIRTRTNTSFGAPKHTGNEPPFLLDFDDPLRFVELTAYPQRSALEPLLTND